MVIWVETGTLLGLTLSASEARRRRGISDPGANPASTVPAAAAAAIPAVSAAAATSVLVEPRNHTTSINIRLCEWRKWNR
jgi:hypothetical protein